MGKSARCGSRPVILLLQLLKSYLYENGQNKMQLGELIGGSTSGVGVDDSTSFSSILLW